MVRVFFTFGSDERFPFGQNDFVEVDGETEEQCIDLYNVVHPPRDGMCNCAFHYPEKQFIPVYRKYYRFERPVEIISVRSDRRGRPPKLLGLDEIYIGDLVWIEENNGDPWKRTTGFAECSDDGMRGKNKDALEFYGCGNFKVLPVSNYGKEWRCWDDRPGLFDREMEKWKE